MLGTRGSRLARKALLVIIVSLTATVSLVAEAIPCKYQSATSNFECAGHQAGPWLYDSQNHYAPPPSSGPYPTFSEAADTALAEIAAYWPGYCYYDHVATSVPWVTWLSHYGISDAERKSYYFEGIVWFTNNTPYPCSHGVQQRVEIVRNRTVFCPGGWFYGYSDSPVAWVCYRELTFPSAKPCEGPCRGSDGPPRRIGSSDPGWKGGVFVHTGDKAHSEVDWKSGGVKPLVVQRSYLSGAFPRPQQTGFKDPGLTSYWRTNFDAHLTQYAATPAVIVAYRPDGTALYFYQSGSTWSSRAEQSEKLENISGGYRLTLADDSKEHYDALGRVIAIIHGDGWTQTLAYGSNELLQSVVDSLGRVLTFSYDGENRLQSITTPDGLIIYGRDPYERLATVTLPDGALRQYKYMEPEHVGSTTGRHGLLTGIVDGNGDRHSTVKYDADRRVYQTELGNGAEKYIIGFGFHATVTDPRGTLRTYYRTLLKGFGFTSGISQPCPTCGPEENVSASTFDSSGNVTSRTSFTGKKTCYAYDTTRNVETARIEGLTSVEDCTASLATPPSRPDVRRVTTTWHATWRKLATIVEPAPGGTRTIAFTYNTSGNLTQRKITAPKNDGTATTITRTWKWTYGTLGRVLTATDPNNRVTTTTYRPDTDPDLGKRGQVATVTNPLAHVTQFTAYDAGNRLTSMIDPNGVVTSLAYDGRGRLTSRTVTGETTTYTYDLAGQLTDVEMADGATVSYVYDTAHRLTEIHDGLGNSIDYALDGMGNRVAEEARDPQGALARTRTRIYDSLNGLAQEVGAQSQTTVMTYDGNGNRLTSTDPLTHTTTSTYDALNRLLTVTDPGNGVARYAYDPSNNLASVTDPRNLVTSYGYDGLDNQIRQVSPDTGTTNRTFDAAGNLKTSTDARGALATYTYDALDRVTRIVYSQTGFASESHTYTYDGGTTGAPNAKGRLTKLVDPSGTTKWTYTPHGRVASRQQIAGSVTLTQSTTWTAGRLTGITTPSGQSVGYSHTNGRISGVMLNGSPLIQNGEYEPFGPVANWAWSNGHTTYRDYDADGRLVSWEFRNGTSILRRDLAWDHANRITAIDDPSSPDNSHNYGYDALDRLATAQSGSAVPTTRHYVYDAIGNRLNATADGALTNYGYSTSSNQLLDLTGATSRTYTYDAVGNPTQIDGRTSTYNLANRLVKLADGAVTVATYKLNGLGQRVAKTIGSTTTRYFYDQQGRLVGEYASNGTLIQETIWLDDIPIATLKPTGTGTPTPVAVYYVHADHLATPRAITRPSDDAIAWRWDNADPFGSNPANQNPSGLGPFTYLLRFQGQQHDPENGTHHNYFRDYDPSLGRYIESDPIGLSGGLNTFLYVDAVPIAFFDEFGLQRGRPPRGPGQPRYGPPPLAEAPYIPVRIYTGSTLACGGCVEIWYVAPAENLSRGGDRRGGNLALIEAMRESASLRERINRGCNSCDPLGHMLSGSGGARNPRNPPEMDWHHPSERPGEVWLIRRCDHQIRLVVYTGPVDAAGGSPNSEPPVMIDYDALRQASMREVARLGLAPSPTLPLSCYQGLTRTTEEVVRRSLCLLCAVAASHGLRVKGMSWLQDNALVPSCTQRERHFLSGNQELKDQNYFRASEEALWAFAWALRLVPVMPVDAYCDGRLAGLFPNPARGERILAFQTMAHLRAEGEIVAMADLMLLVHNAMRNASIQGRQPSIDMYVIEHRRRAIEWLLTADDYEDVSLDT